VSSVEIIFIFIFDPDPPLLLILILILIINLVLKVLFSAEYYKACLAFHTSTNLTAEEIHQKVLDEVGKIEEEMREVIKEMGLNLTLPKFMEKLRY